MRRQNNTIGGALPKIAKSNLVWNAPVERKGG